MGLGPTRDLGPCQIDWGTDNLGAFWEEVRFRFEEGFADIFEAGFGQQPVDSVFIGSGVCELTTPFTRITIANLVKVIPGGSASTSGINVYDNKVGTSMYDLAKPVFVKPIVGGTAVTNGQWLRINKAYPIPNFDLAYNLRDQRVYPVTWKCFPDASTKMLWAVGKVPTATT